MRSFIDTNILLYVDSLDEPVKQPQATQLVAQHLRAGTGVVSTQVLNEFSHAALRKFGLPLDIVRERVRTYSRLDVVPASAEAVLLALELLALQPLSFWDALIVNAARQSGCAQLLTEDLTSGAVIGGVRVVNPFAPEPTSTSYAAARKTQRRR